MLCDLSLIGVGTNFWSSLTLWFMIWFCKLQLSRNIILLLYLTINWLCRANVSNMCKKMSYYLHLIGLHKRWFNQVTNGLFSSFPYTVCSTCVKSIHVSTSYFFYTTITETSESAVCIIFSLNKFDYVMEYYKQLQWLNLNRLIQFCLARVMFYQYHE